jgi:hypothetical protein
MKKQVICLALAAAALSSCGGGKKEDFDKATYLLSRGGGVNGLKAADLVEPYLTSGDIMTRMRAARIFAGGKINAAGLDGAKFLANLAHGRSEGNTVKFLRTVLLEAIPVEVSGRIIDSRSEEEAGAAAETYLLAAASAVATVRGAATYTAITTGTAAYCRAHKELCREKESLEVVLANAQFMRALNVAIRLSTLGSGTFDNDECQDYFQANSNYIDIFSTALFEARTHYALAGLDDELFAGANGAVDTANSKPAGFIDDIQDQVDSDKDGDIPGTDLERATVVCAYLSTQE